MADLVELRPCPFCGGEMELQHDHTTEDVDQIVHKIPSIDCPINGASGFSIGNDWLVKAWNTRASPLTTERREWLKAICRRSRETFIRRAGTKNGIAQYGADIDGAIVDDLLAALIAGPVSEGESA